MKNVLEIKKLSFSFSGKKLFENVNFSLPAGQICGLQGVNGTGKSTLIDLIMGIRPFLYGDIEVLGFNPLDNRREHLNHTVLVSQSYGMPDHITGQDIFNIFRIAYARFSEQRLAEVVKTFEIDPRLKLNKLSEGFKKRVHVAAA